MIAKNGPVYSAAWSPLSTEFCVVYGCILSSDDFVVDAVLIEVFINNDFLIS